jgi:hypothetical protein
LVILTVAECQGPNLRPKLRIDSFSQKLEMEVRMIFLAKAVMRMKMEVNLDCNNLIVDKQDFEKIKVPPAILLCIDEIVAAEINI